MTINSDLLKKDWETLISAPSKIGHDIMIASSTRFLLGARKEMKAMREAISDSNSLFRENRLIRKIMPRSEEIRKSEGWHRSLRKKRKEYHEETLELCKEVASILDRCPNLDEVKSFKQWLLYIGESVANAFLTDEFMGIGGVVVSKEEEKVLKEIAIALGVHDYRVRKEP